MNQQQQQQQNQQLQYHQQQQPHLGPQGSFDRVDSERASGPSYGHQKQQQLIQQPRFESQQYRQQQYEQHPIRHQEQQFGQEQHQQHSRQIHQPFSQPQMNLQQEQRNPQKKVSTQQPQPLQQLQPAQHQSKQSTKHLHFEELQQPSHKFHGQRDPQVQQPSFVELKGGTDREVSSLSFQSLSLPPASMIGCSPSLMYLVQIDQLIIKQKKEMLEVLTGMDMPNNYVVLNIMGQPIYYASEKSSAFVRHCCGPTRSFEICLADSNGEEVLHVSRPYKCMCLHQGLSCMKCCKDLVTVCTPSGQIMGQVRQIHRKCDATYEILDAEGYKVLSIDGPNYCHCYCPGDDIPFSVKTHDGQEVGRVSRQWSNLMQEYFTDADNFGITFPVDLNLNVKATIIGACFLIDFMFFEKSGRMF